MVSSNLPDALADSHRSGHSHRPDGDDHIEPGTAPKVRQAQKNRPLDLADLDGRVRNGGNHLLSALPDLSAEVAVGVQPSSGPWISYGLTGACIKTWRAGPLWDLSLFLEGFAPR